MPSSKTGGVGMLMATGTLSSLVGKALYELRAPGQDGTLKSFQKPLASSLFMFLGMLACLPASLLYRTVASQLRRHGNGGGVSSNGDGSEEPLLPPATASTVSLHRMAESTVAWWHRYDAVVVPTCFDLAATVLLSVGLLFVTLSTYQMCRGTEIVFTALLSVAFLKRKLSAEHLAGLGLCTLGIVLVGWSSVLSSKDGDAQQGVGAHPTRAQTLTGIALIVLAEAVQASQITAEDYLLTMAPTEISPAEVVG